NQLRAQMEASTAPRDDRFRERWHDIPRLVDGAVAKFAAEPAPTANEAPAFSEEAIALLFATERADDARYVAAWSKWLRYDGKCWRADETVNTFDAVRATCRAVALEANKPGMRRTICSAKTVAAVERLARSDRRLAATSEQWDADIWALNT